MSETETQISETVNPLPCKVGDKGLYVRHGEEHLATVLKVYSNGLVDLEFDEGKQAVDIPVKLEIPADGPVRWFHPGGAPSKSVEAGGGPPSQEGTDPSDPEAA